jgi:hypothetical protein
MKEGKEEIKGTGGGRGSGGRNREINKRRIFEEQ